MADSIKGLTVEIGGDTTKLGKALENVNKKSKDLSSELGQINRLLKLDPGNATLLAQKQKVLAEAVENTAKKLKTLKEAEKQVQKQFERGEVSEEQVRALQREIAATERKLDSYKGAAKETEKAIRGVGDESKKTEKKSSDLGKALGGAVIKGLAAVAAAAGAAATAMAAATVNAAAYADEILTLSTVTGMSTDDLQAFGYAAGLLDVDVETLTKSMAKNVKSMSSAATGSKAYADAYAQLGVSVTDANGNLRDSEAVYWEAIDALGQMTNETERDAVAMQLFGKSAQELNPLIEAGSEKINELKQEAKDVGAVMSEDTLAALGAFDDSVQRMKGSAGAAKNALGGVLLPELQLLTDTGTELLNEFTTKLNESGGGLDGFASVMSQMSGKISGILVNLVKQLGAGVANIAGPLITNLVNGFNTYLPIVVSKGGELLGKLGEGIKNAMPGLISKGLDIIMGLVTTLYNAAPGLIDAGFGFIKNLVQGLMDSLPTLLSKVPEIVSKFANILNDNVPRILKHGFDIIVQIVKGIIQAIPTLVANIPKIITAIVDVWEAFNWLSLGKKAFTLLKNGITSMLGAIKGAATSIMNGCTNTLRALPGKLLSLGKSAISGLGSAIRSGLGTVKAGASTIFNGIVNYFKTLPSRMLSIGKDLIKGLWNGISDMSGWIIGKLQGFGDSVLQGIKNFFGISSPSRTMADEVGKWIPAGMAEVITGNAKAATRAMAGLSQDIMDASPEVGGIGFERSLSSTARRSTYGTGAAFLGDGAVLAKLEAIYQRLDKLQVVLDSGALVGGIMEPIDRSLASRQALRARGV